VTLAPLKDMVALERTEGASIASCNALQAPRDLQLRQQAERQDEKVKDCLSIHEPIL
jgi:hypothetical protein